MTEEFLHYIWKYKQFSQNLTLTNGEDCTIIDPGIHNFDSGPDFFNAKIKIGDTLWAGNVEIHVKSSDWYLHKHHKDMAYENIILHVVHHQDQKIYRINKEEIPAFELKDRFNHSLYAQYSDFMTNRNWIPCEKMLDTVNRFAINNWLDRIMIERLEAKAIEIEKQLIYNGNDWEQTFYEFLARNFGFNVNSLPFELLAKSLPLKFLLKHKDNKFQLESLLFGQSGLLNQKYKDDYPSQLFKEYSFLSKKYNLKSIDTHLWRFMRLRPSNFPTIRIAQLADLIYNSSLLFSKIIETEKFKELIRMFEVSESEYWKAHYVFDKKAVKRDKRMGMNAINLVIINTVTPFLFVYGRTHNNQSFIDRSLKFLDTIPGETNAIIRKWGDMGMSIRTSFNTQALLQLKKHYCNKRKCLNCGIGNEIFKSAR
ncbi:MAG: DUF2851 family protein [Bacteroidales bacterium]|nr:DUF2851 family protein [Bacteroidales bacterium]